MPHNNEKYVFQTHLIDSVHTTMKRNTQMMPHVEHAGHRLSCESSCLSLMIHKNAQFFLLHLLFFKAFLWDK